MQLFSAFQLFIFLFFLQNQVFFLVDYLNVKQMFRSLKLDFLETVFLRGFVSLEDCFATEAQNAQAISFFFFFKFFFVFL